MGIYNTYGDNGLQLKVGDPCLYHFDLGDKVDIPDGVYIEYGGVVVIKDGIFIAEYPELTDKWGGVVTCDEILDERHWMKNIKPPNSRT